MQSIPSETANIFTPLGEYITGLKRILQEIRKTNAKIIWATMTPVDRRFVYCRNDEIDRYNQVALEFMQSENIAIDDLNAIIREDVDAYIGEGLLHLSEKGQRTCAEAVVNAVMKYM